MAEALDTYSDLDMSDTDDEGDLNTNKEFNLAADHVKKIVSKLEPNKLLEVYGLYKQATEGPCNTQRPKWYEMQAKQKWDAWNAVGDISSQSAKEKYVNLIQELDPDWNQQNGKKKKGFKMNNQWAAVSSLHSNEEENSETEKTVFDFCKEGATWEVQNLLESQPDLLKKLDSEGLGLIHWAADRGNPDMLKLLLQHKCDASMRDNSGQTALHYAASCGHADCVTVLLEYGANKTLLDNDGLSPMDTATEDYIEQLLI